MWHLTAIQRGVWPLCSGFALSLDEVSDVLGALILGRRHVQQLWPGFILRTTPEYWVLSPFYRWGSWGSKRLKILAQQHIAEQRLTSHSPVTKLSHHDIYPLVKNTAYLLDISNRQIKSNSLGLVYIYTQMADKDCKGSADPPRTWRGWEASGNAGRPPRFNQSSVASPTGPASLPLYPNIFFYIDISFSHVFSSVDWL